MGNDFENFVHLATHDLKEPARKIAAFGERLAQETAGTLNPKASLFLEKMLDAAQRMQTMLDDLHAYSHLNIKELNSIDLADFIKKNYPNIGLTTTTNPSILADKTLLLKLLDELNKNATAFGSPNNTPDVSIISKSDKIQLIFSNEGDGIPQQFGKEVFLPFKKLVGRSESKGSGMGLAIVAKIAQIHGGVAFLGECSSLKNEIIIELPEKTHGD